MRILLLPFLFFCASLSADFWPKLLERKINDKFDLSKNISIGSSVPKEQFVRLNGVYMDNRRIAGGVSLPMRQNRFYLSQAEILLYFGSKVSGVNFTNAAGFVLNTALLSRGNIGRSSLLSFLGSAHKYRYPVKEVAQLFGYNAVYNSQSRLLKFFRYPNGKSPLLSDWRAVLKQQGLDGYVEKIMDIILKKRPKQSGPVQSDGNIPEGAYEFQRVYTTSFEAQQIASAGKRGDWYMRDEDIGAALPSRAALGQWIEVYYPKTGRRVQIEVIDVGPWNIDDPYWERKSRPSAESGSDERGRRTNMAGLDLSYQAWAELGVDKKRAYSGTHSDYVHWDFIER